MISIISLINSDKVAIVDNKYHYIVAQYKWRLQTNGYVVSSCCKEHPLIYLHKLILNVHLNRNILVDHKDRDKLNCKEDNLRIASQSQNMCNTSKQKGNYTSKVKGVSFHKPSGKWQAYIMKNGKQIRASLSLTEDEAIIKANELRLKYHGTFATL